MAITPARQRNAVSEGMALGLLMCGRGELPFDKTAIDLSFEGAWRSWPHTGRFKQVSTDLRNGSDGVWVMLHADKDKRVLNLYWETDMRTISIRARGYWEDDEIDADVVADGIDGDLPAEAWKQLAEAFLSRLERD
jgi:hypothetical protein